MIEGKILSASPPAWLLSCRCAEQLPCPLQERVLVDNSDSRFSKTKSKNRNGIFYAKFSDLVLNVDAMEERELEGRKKKGNFLREFHMH